MKYGLTQISKEEFDNLHAFVRACFDQGYQRRDPPLLKSISIHHSWAPQEHQEYLARNDSLGVTMGTHEFDIWITPAYKGPVFKFYMTLAHELVHGYAGLKYGHNAHWRRWFYRVLFHLVEAKIIPTPESDIQSVLLSVELSYNPKWWQSGAAGLVDEAINKAQQEHSKVLDSYWSRLA